MRCIICHGPEIKLQQVDEIIKFGSDIMLITLSLQVCTQCGERYYSREAMKTIESMRDKVRRHEIDAEPVGVVLRAKAA